MHIPTAEASTDRVLCRPNRGQWWLMTLPLFMGGLALSMPVLCGPPTATPPPPMWPMWLFFDGMASIFLGAALALGLWLTRGYILATPAGLEWRGTWRLRKARWEEVTDYYETAGVQTGMSCVVETRHGKCNFYRSLSHLHELKAAIERHARHGRARGWGLRYTRDEDDWPQVFTASSADKRFARPMLAGVLLVMVACYATMIVPDLIKLKATYGIDPGWWWILTMVAGRAALFGVLTVFCCFIVATVSKQVRRDSDLRVTVDRAGITYENTGRRIEARWDEVTDYYMDTSKQGGVEMPRGSVIETTRGSFVFGQLPHALRLRQIIERRATAVGQPGWEKKPAVATPVASPQAPRHYRFRNPTARAMLFFITALTAIGVVAPLINPSPGTSLAVRVFTAVIVALPAAWAWWRFRCAGVVINENSITQMGLRGPRRIAWADVTDYYVFSADIMSGIIVLGDGKRLWISNLIDDYESLKHEISRRAIACPDKSWV